MERTNLVSRREALRNLGLLATGLALGACTPLRILTHAYPDDFKHAPRRVDEVLRAFVEAVIPGAVAGAPDSPDLARALLDPAYPFARYAEFFAADLCRRAGKRCGSEAFHHLSLAQRTLVIRDGLEGDGTTHKLYQGAIHLAQVSFYGGIYHDDAGCPLIDFPGHFHGEEVSYQDCHRFLPRSTTQTGNYV